MNSVLAWMETTRVHYFMLHTILAFRTCQSLHFLGLILLFGSVAMVDLRLLGVAPSIPPRAVMAYLPITAIGFAINLITGMLFCFADPFRYYPNPAFRLKMLAILLAGLNAVWFKLALGEKIERGEPLHNGAKFLAAGSLILWVCVIIGGRMIAYVRHGG